MRIAIFASILAVMQLSACADFPDLKSAVSDEAIDAPFPRLWSFQSLEDYSGPTADVASAQLLEARAAKLRKISESLAGPVFEKEERQFLLQSMQK